MWRLAGILGSLAMVQPMQAGGAGEPDGDPEVVIAEPISPAAPPEMLAIQETERRERPDNCVSSGRTHDTCDGGR